MYWTENNVRDEVRLTGTVSANEQELPSVSILEDLEELLFQDENKVTIPVTWLDIPILII